MPVYYDQTRKRWRYQYRRTVNGRRVQAVRLLPTGWSQRQAEAYDRKESARIEAEASGIQSPRLRLSAAVQLYLDHKVPKLRNGRKAALDLAHLFNEIQGAYLDEVGALAQDYVKAHPELSEGTIHNRLAYLRAAVNYARKHHGYGRELPNPTEEMHIPIPANERQVYAKLPDLDRLWDAFKEPEAKALFRLAFYMGLRWRAELLHRTKEDIDEADGVKWLRVGVTKNGNPIMKPVNPVAEPDLAYIPFSHADTWFYGHWRASVESIERPDLRPHDLRHSLASHVLSRPGGTLDDVRAALHHQSLQASKRYAHLYPEAAKRILFSVNSGENLHPPTEGETGESGLSD